MKALDQINISDSLERALVPGLNMLDGRTERDRLAFFADFGSLINFYDHNNAIKGNWTPFILKDPVFLMASISKTDFSKVQTLYINTCNKLEQLIVTKKPLADLAHSFNQLFDQLTRTFMHIERWTYYMQMTVDDYSLKRYVIQQIQNNLSQYFWAIQSLRQYLAISNYLGNIEQVKYYLFENFDKLIWQQSQGLMPFQELLGIKLPESNLTTEIAGSSNAFALDCFNGLKKAGDILLKFYNTVIHHSVKEYETLCLKKSKYPDTTLIRAFAKLMEYHQAELNNLAQKHLTFYYNDILKQSTNPARPDSAYIFATLAKTDEAFTLPKDTVFNAGLDAQKNPIQFSTQKDTRLNPGAINNVFNLSALPSSRQGINVPVTASGLYMENIATPGTIKKDANGNIISWETFGPTSNQNLQVSQIGFAFASPMLYLLEGKRTITIDFTFKPDNSTPDYINQLQASFTPPNASYYLSTQSAWFNAKNCVVINNPQKTQPYTVSINLNLTATDPPIQAFTKNPDNINASWPLLKVMFNSFFNMANPPVINSIGIRAQVEGATTYLYNDYGALSTKAPFQMFGPTPAQNNNFIIGSNEIFSKKLDTLVINLEWNSLPVPTPPPATPPQVTSFSIYYLLYNIFLHNQLSRKVIIDEIKSNGKQSGFLSNLKNIFFKLFGIKTGNTAKINPTLPQLPETGFKEIFKNTAFTVEFKLLENGAWGDVAWASGTNDPADYLFSFSPDSDSSPVSSTKEWNLHGLSNNPDPGIQNLPFAYTDTSTSGFLRITLNNPLMGFGSGIYPAILTWVTQLNAEIIAYNIAKTAGWPLIPLPNPPFVPSVKTFKATYVANHVYTITNTDTYPLQFYYYTPFASYTAYDNNANTSIPVVPIAGQNAPGLTIIPSFPANGASFISMQNLVAPDSFNFFFDFAPNYNANSAVPQFSFYCLTNQGWNLLNPSVDDGTNGFNCTGLIQLNVPETISNTSPYMPGPNYWIAITCNGNLAEVSQTSFLTTNGVELKRTGSFYLTSTVAPEINSGTITGPQNTIAQIASVSQPFASEGGKAAELPANMNTRVSKRLKTKDKAVTPSDFFTLIEQKFTDIFYSTTFYDNPSGSTKVCVAQQISNSANARALNPSVQVCEIDKIQTYLTKRVSLFSNVAVSNFDYRYVCVTATITPKAGYGKTTLINNVTSALKFYLSPWIADGQNHIEIGKEINASQIAAFIKSLEGVSTVANVSLSALPLPASAVQPAQNTTGSTTLSLLPGQLFVSALNHNITSN